MGAVLLVLAAFAMAQQPASMQTKVIKQIPVKQTNAASGQEMFTNYCAVCHGTDGKGSGPAASALKMPPTDLTALTGKNSGKYACTSPAFCAEIRNCPRMATKTCRYGVQCSVT
jgi:mono/diheme cytochrome c family protein